MNDRKINIQINKSTHAALEKVGSKGDTFDDVIRMLLQAYDSSINFDSFNNNNLQK